MRPGNLSFLGDTMTQLASDPALNTTTAQPTDLLVLLRPATQANGTVTYQPLNITGTNALSSLILPVLAALIDGSPTQDGTNALFWNNGGQLQRTTGGGNISGQPLTAQALQESFVNLFGKAPTADPKVAGEAFNPGDGLVHWSNGGQ